MTDDEKNIANALRNTTNIIPIGRYLVTKGIDIDVSDLGKQLRLLTPRDVSDYKESAYIIFASISDMEFKDGDYVVVVRNKEVEEVKWSTNAIIT